MVDFVMTVVISYEAVLAECMPGFGQHLLQPWSFVARNLICMFASIQVKVLLKLLFNLCSPICHPRGVLCLIHKESELLLQSKMAKG